MDSVTYSVTSMPGELKLPHRDHRTLANPPLKVMLGQVRFDPILQVDRADFIAPLQEVLRKDYPQFGPQQEVQLVLGPDGAFRSETSKSWRFATSDNAWSIILSPTFVTLEADAPQYVGYDDFRKRFHSVWNAVLEHVRPTRCVQQGLRYINHIEKDIESDEWTQFINGELLGPMASSAFGKEIQYCVSDLKLARPDGQLSIKYGLTQAGPQQSSGYLLDFDYVNQDQSTKLDADGITERFDDFHAVLFDFFCWALDPEYLKEIEGSPSSDAE